MEGEGFISRRGAESAEVGSHKEHKEHKDDFGSWGFTPDPECELIDLCGSESRSIRRNVSEAPLRTFLISWLVVGS